MHLKTKLIQILLLCFLIISNYSCISTAPGVSYSSVEKTEKVRDKIAKSKEKEAKKAKKEAHKAYWDKQSKNARRLIKYTEKNRKRIEKGKRPKEMKRKG